MYRIIIAALALTHLSGCAALVSLATKKGVNVADLESWKGVSLAELETHPLFATMPVEKRSLSDGGSLWIFTNTSKSKTAQQCTSQGTLKKPLYGSDSIEDNTQVVCSGGEFVTTSCSNQFIIRDGTVLEYRAVGACFTDCSVRPKSKPCPKT